MKITLLVGKRINKRIENGVKVADLEACKAYSFRSKKALDKASLNPNCRSMFSKPYFIVYGDRQDLLGKTFGEIAKNKLAKEV